VHARSDRRAARAARGRRRREHAPRRSRARRGRAARADARTRSRSAVPDRARDARVQGVNRMAGELTMPKPSDPMADAGIVRWLKSPGEEFRRGEALIEVETDKATVVYDAETDGTL